MSKQDGWLPFDDATENLSNDHGFGKAGKLLRTAFSNMNKDAVRVPQGSLEKKSPPDRLNYLAF